MKIFALLISCSFFLTASLCVAANHQHSGKTKPLTSDTHQSTMTEPSITNKNTHQDQNNQQRPPGQSRESDVNWYSNGESQVH